MTIHSNDCLPRIEKFKYLLTYLTEEAKEAVEGIRISDSNYDITIGILKSRFGGNDLLIDEHLNQLLLIARVSRSSDIEALRHLYDQVVFRTNCLEGQGVPSGQYAVLLHRMLMRALPEDLAIAYRQKVKEPAPPPTYTDDLQEISALQRAE